MGLTAVSGGASSLLPQVIALGSTKVPVLFDIDQADSLFEERSSPTTQSSVDGVIGYMSNLIGSDDAVAPSDSARPILRETTERYVDYDLVDDYFEITLSSTVSNGQAYYCTPYGWYKAAKGEYSAGALRLSGADLTKYLLLDLDEVTSGDLTLIEAYMANTEYAAIFKTSDTTIYNAIDNTTEINYTLNYFDDSNNTYNLASSQAGQTVDVGAQGLSAPIHMRYPIDVQADGSLVTWASRSNQHTGPLPDISGLTGLVSWYSHSNQHTGPLPDILDMTNLVTWYSHTNQLTGGFPSGVPASLLTIRMENNLLTQAAVDSILNDLVTAGSSNGTVNVGGTGNAAPSGAGAADAATLVSRGWTVTTN